MVAAAVAAAATAVATTVIAAVSAAAGRLVAPFGGVTLDTPGYFLITRTERQHDPVVKTFCDWLLEQGANFETQMNALIKKSNTDCQRPASPSSQVAVGVV